jgi:ABC-type oligopeptide transport system ATPase subunit
MTEKAIQVQNLYNAVAGVSFSVEKGKTFSLADD